jgi:small subunit ribosomal protein S2
MSIAQWLIDAKALFGHPKNYSNPKTRYSRAGVSGNSVVFDETAVAQQIEKAKSIFQAAKQQNLDVLVLCEKEIYKTEIEILSAEAWFHYMNHKIPAGILSNFDTLLMRIKNLKEMRSYVTSESFSLLTKKEQNMKKRDLEKVEKVYKWVVNLRKKPGLVIIVDGQLMQKFVKEVVSTKTNAVVLTSSNFNLFTDTHLVTCNVNSQRSVDFVLKAITK